MPGSALIGVDWGTSSFRAVLLAADGRVLDRRAGPHGILTVADRDFGAVLRTQIGKWLRAAPVPVLMSGMIGSRQGWLEASYVSCPVGLADVAAGLVPVPFQDADVRIMPGVETATATMRDVMRGEEVQVFGALTRSGAAEATFLLPGTHSKWVRAEEARITEFSTYMTGELFAACRDHTILGRLMAGGGGDLSAFARGVRDGARAGGPGALLNRLFGVRTAGLFGEIEGADLPDYLSGMLIGAEFADAGLKHSGPLQIIASDALAERYRDAAAEMGMAAEIGPSDAIVGGYLAVAEMGGLLPRSRGL